MVKIKERDDTKLKNKPLKKFKPVKEYDSNREREKFEKDQKKIREEIEKRTQRTNQQIDMGVQAML